MPTPTLSADFRGHQLAYRVAGKGPAFVALYLYRRKEDLRLATALSERCQVFQIFPIGFGYSDRVPGFAGELLAAQVEAVLDAHGASRFVVWGYSAGGAMATLIAHGSQRAAGMIAGGFAFDALTPGVMRRMDKRLPIPHPSRSLWSCFTDQDWWRELDTMSCARLLYCGSEDRQMARRLRKKRDELSSNGAEFLEFPGLDHATCNEAPALQSSVIPAVRQWMDARVGPSW